MEINIRQERSSDYAMVSEIIAAAFKEFGESDQKEHLLVERLRESNAFFPELSIVAESENEIIGHILLTKIQIKNETSSFESLALAPVSVKPEFQGKGIGGLLIKESHKVAKRLGYQSIVLVGHDTYYPRFGYELASKYGIELPFDVPEENCLVIPLAEDGLDGVNGKGVYPKEFFM